MTAVQRLDRVEALDVAVMSVGQAQAALRDLGVVRGRVEQLEGAITRRLTELHAAGGAPAADVLGRQGRRSRRDAERAEARGRTLGDVPSLDQALGDGKVGAEHADAVATRLDHQHRASLFDHDTEITELAASLSPESFRRRLARLVDEITDDDGLDRHERQQAAATASIRTDNDTGMHKLHAMLTPEQGNRIRRRLDTEIAALTKLPEHTGLRRDQLAAIALDRLITGTHHSTTVGPPEVAVLIDLATLTTGRHPHTVSEYSDSIPIPVATARRHACDARILPVVLNGDGLPLDVGRARRLATPTQRIALRAMYRTCAINGCDHHYDTCHIHHLHEWDQLGPTDLDNLLPLCSFHHHRAHEGRWQLQLDPSTRHLTVTLPDGTHHSTSLPDLLHERQRHAA